MCQKRPTKETYTNQKRPEKEERRYIDTVPFAQRLDKSVKRDLHKAREIDKKKSYQFKRDPYQSKKTKTKGCV